MNAGKVVAGAELAKHFSAAFLKQVPPAQLIAALGQVAAARPFRLTEVLGSSGTALAGRLDGASGASLKVTIEVESSMRGLITGLLFAPFTEVAKPTSWAEVDKALAALAGQATMVAVEVGKNAPVHSRQPDQSGAIGSAFKLYVLAALGRAVQQGTASWDEKLAIRAAWKSLPSGDLRNAPDGKQYTLRYLAEQMISVSDNTAADHLLHRVGRAAVEAELSPMGVADPQRDLPFLTTREMFALKLSAPATLRDAYIAGDSAARRRLLARIDALPISMAGAASWVAPRDISTIEWFASPNDLARTMVALRTLSQQPGLGPLRAILAKNPGIPFDKTTWRYEAFKGGSEPGVLSLTWLLERADGRTFVLSLVLNDPAKPIDEAGTVAVAQGAVDLLAKVK
jgi:beta-lactamase class A